MFERKFFLIHLLLEFRPNFTLHSPFRTKKSELPAHVEYVSKVFQGTHLRECTRRSF